MFFTSVTVCIGIRSLNETLRLKCSFADLMFATVTKISFTRSHF